MQGVTETKITDEVNKQVHAISPHFFWIFLRILIFPKMAASIRNLFVIAHSKMLTRYKTGTLKVLTIKVQS